MVEAPVLKRLLVLVPKAKGLSPGQRFRLEQWAPRAEAHGLRFDFVPFESDALTRVLHEPGRYAEKAGRVLFDFARRAVPVARAKSYDGVIVYREAALLGPALYERVLDWLGVPLFLDFDDAIWHPGQISSANGIFSRLHFFGKTRTLCRLVDTVLVGNDYLAGWARAAGARRVEVLPTSIELDHYPVQPEAADPERFVVGWSGSLSTLAHFEHARGALEELAKRRPLTVRIICNKPPERPIAGAENVFVKWSKAGEARELAACHAGIMPLPDDEYTRGKCGLKALQFMAVGRPVVISPVGMNATLVRSGENGLLAGTTEEWVSALERLAASPALRAELGAAGRSTIERGYSAEVLAERFATVIKGTLGARP